MTVYSPIQKGSLKLNSLIFITQFAPQEVGLHYSHLLPYPASEQLALPILPSTSHQPTHFEPLNSLSTYDLTSPFGQANWHQFTFFIGNLNLSSGYI